MTVVVFSGNLVQLHGTTSVLNGINGQTYEIDTYLNISLSDSANNPINFVSDASVGLSGVDFVADVTAASGSGGFYYQANMWACGQLFGCETVSQLFNDYRADGSGAIQALTSVNTGFFSAPRLPLFQNPKPTRCCLPVLACWDLQRVGGNRKKRLPRSIVR